MSGTLVLGTAMGYGASQMDVFVRSLRRHHAGAATLLVASSIADDAVALLDRHGIERVYFDSAARIPLELQVSRYLRYAELMRAHCAAGDRVLLTDVGDVLFQGDPFGGAPDAPLVLAMEDARATIGACASNSFWIRNLFGEPGIAQLGNRRISCSGTTLGERDALLAYIDQLMALADPATMQRLTPYRGHDQGMHNALLHTGRLPGAHASENGDWVLTLGHVPDDEIVVRAGAFHGPRGNVPPIVHQYPVKPRALAAVRDAWG
jgi:hypothetical protein